MESRGIATISITLKPEISFGVKVPRAAFVRFPLGYPFGEPARADLQSKIIGDLLSLVQATPGPPADSTESGPIFQLPYRWKVD